MPKSVRRGPLAAWALQELHDLERRYKDEERAARRFQRKNRRRIPVKVAGKTVMYLTP